LLQGDETLVLELQVKSGWLGRFLDPRVELALLTKADRQTFERGVDGVRFLNLTGLAVPLQAVRACAGAIAGCRASRACG
jgi:hypothetical protein